MKCARLCWNARMEPMCCCSKSTCEHFQHARTLMMMMMASPNLSVPQIRAASFQRIAAAKCRNPREMRGSSAAGILMVTFRMSHSLPVCVCVQLLPTARAIFASAVARNALQGACGCGNECVHVRGSSAERTGTPPNSPPARLLSGVTLSFIIRAGEQARSEKFVRTTTTTMRQRCRRQR